MTVVTDPMGAELKKVKGVVSGIDYLWSGDPAFWGKTSPVLFPIVGSLQQNHYRYKGTTYTLPRHGIAREKLFRLVRATDTEALFSLEDDESTRVVYPFRFCLQIGYRLVAQRLTITYSVYNTVDDDLYFSIGAHPAFAVPLEPGLAYEDYWLAFDQAETAGRWMLEDGLLLDRQEPCLQGEKRIPLRKELFDKDALVFKGLRSSMVTLGTDRSTHGLTMGIEGWPHLGLWAAKGAPFVCIEPWQGHSDPVRHDGELTRKPGIVRLPGGESWERSWWMEIN